MMTAFVSDSKLDLTYASYLTLPCAKICIMGYV